MFTSVFSFVVVAGVDCWITVVVISFFSAGGLVTVVSFCSQAAKSAMPASRQMYFFIPTIRISARSLAVFSGRNILLVRHLRARHLILVPCANCLSL